MKLSIGENIRSYRKKNDLTQEAFAERLGVSYQSVSRWENGSTYPDLELIPAISGVLGVTVDELFGLPGIEKEKRAEEAFDALRRECLRSDYDAGRIVELIRDIRRNYMDSESAWRPWCEGNGRAFRDPAILPEVRLMAEAYLERQPAFAPTIRTMAEIEDEEHLQSFLKQYAAPVDCSARALLFHRYGRRGDAERYDKERRFQLFSAFDVLLCPSYLLNYHTGKEERDAADEWMETLLSAIRRDAADDGPDMWVVDRLELGTKAAKRLIGSGKTKEAIAKIASVVNLLEETMRITEKTVLPTSCGFLEGMEWTAWEEWDTPDNDPDSPVERMIRVETTIDGMYSGKYIFPRYYETPLHDSEFDPVRDDPDFKKLCDRVKALIVTK